MKTIENISIVITTVLTFSLIIGLIYWAIKDFKNGKL